MERRISKKEMRDIDNAQCIILFMDFEGLILLINRFASDYFGFGYSLIGCNVVGTIVPERDSAGRDMRLMIRSIGRNLADRAGNENENQRLRNGKLERVWISWKNIQIEIGEGRAPVLMCIGTDISERKKAEVAMSAHQRKLAMAMGVVGAGIWEWEMPGDAMRFDAEWYRLAGYEPDEFRGSYEEWEKRVHPEDLTHCVQEIRNFVRGKNDTLDVVYRFLRKDMSWMWIRSEGRVMERDDDGMIRLIIGTNRDISRRKEVEIKRYLKAKFDALGLMAGGIAHIVNNLNLPIMSCAQMLLFSRSLDSSQRSLAESVFAAARSLREFIERMEIFSRGDYLNRIPIEIEPMLEDIVSRIFGDRHECECYLSSGVVPIQAIADARLLRQAMENLFLYIVSSMPSSSKVRIVCHPSDNPKGLAPGSYIHIMISDAAETIPGEIIEKMFDPFYVLSKKTGNSNSFGLTAAYFVIEKHGGTISVEPVEGVGNRFHVYIPSLVIS